MESKKIGNKEERRSKEAINDDCARMERKNDINPFVRSLFFSDVVLVFFRFKFF